MDAGNEIIGNIYALMDAKGQIIKTGLVSEKSIIQMETFPPGVYFLRINCVNQTFKMIKQ
jgi:hypothetical protein